VIEVRIPISPVQHYYNRVHLLAHSIRSLGGEFKDARIRVSVGSHDKPIDLHRLLPWSRRLGIDWHWVERDQYAAWDNTAHPYIATMMDRFRPPFDAETLLMLDADVVVVRPFPEILTLVSGYPSIAGVMAHVPPFAPDEWRTLFRQAELTEPELKYECSGWGVMLTDPKMRYCPPYFNTGVLAASRKALELLYDPYMASLQTVRSLHDTYFFEQIALTLALYRTGIKSHVLPLRYNYPNQQGFDVAFPDELNEIRFLHFLRTDTVNREDDFLNWAKMKKLSTRQDLTGSNEVFRKRLAQLMPQMWEDLQFSERISRAKENWVQG
jgi:hypothetical protein